MAMCGFALGQLCELCELCEMRGVEPAMGIGIEVTPCGDAMPGFHQ
jgi:hypothetical protein